MMKAIRQVTTFKRDLKRITKRNKKNLQKLYDVVALLSNGFPPKEYHRSHKLVGDYAQKWECHIEPDWLLIYEITEEKVILYRTGSHADLFS